MYAHAHAHSRLAEHIRFSCSMSSSPSFAADEPATLDHEANPPRPRRRATTNVATGALRIVLIIASHDGLYANSQLKGNLAANPLALGSALLMGAVVTTWSLASAQDAAPGESTRSVREMACRDSHTLVQRFFVDYLVQKSCSCTSPPQFRLDLFKTASALLNMFGETAAQVTIDGGRPPCSNRVVSLREVLNEWSYAAASPFLMVRLTPILAERIVSGTFSCLHSVLVSQRVARKRWHFHKIHRDPSKAHAAETTRKLISGKC